MVMEKVKAVLMGTDLNGAPTKETEQTHYRLPHRACAFHLVPTEMER